MECETARGVGGDAPELANLAVAGLVFGQVISDQPFSWRLVLVGIFLWFGLVAVTIALAGVGKS